MKIYSHLNGDGDGVYFSSAGDAIKSARERAEREDWPVSVYCVSVKISAKSLMSALNGSFSNGYLLANVPRRGAIRYMKWI